MMLAIKAKESIGYYISNREYRIDNVIMVNL